MSHYYLRTARTPRECDAMSCQTGGVKPGDRYARLVAFPGDDGNSGGNSVLTAAYCPACLDARFRYARDRDKVPARPDARVADWNGATGTLVWAYGRTVYMRRDDGGVVPYTARDLTYLDAAGGAR